jgi:hypothetical protein
MIGSTYFVNERWLKIAQDAKNWNRKSTKTSMIEELTNVLDFHESRMIHWK